MKGKKYLTLLAAICIFSYFIMVNSGASTLDENKHTYDKIPQEETIKTNIYDYRDLYEKALIDFTKEISGLEYDLCKFLVVECRENHLDPFLVLGLIKRESDFNPKAVGAGGELGLGQLMENTARVIAENLGYAYEHEMLLDPEFNLKLTITQLSYLKNLYEDDLHKVLTAYNRGQQGLRNYLKTYNERGISDYSSKVLQYATDFKEEFRKR